MSREVSTAEIALFGRWATPIRSIGRAVGELADVRSVVEDIASEDATSDTAAVDEVLRARAEGLHRAVAELHRDVAQMAVERQREADAPSVRDSGSGSQGSSSQVNITQHFYDEESTSAGDPTDPTPRTDPHPSWSAPPA